MKSRFSPLCWFNRHAPMRNRTRWDGAHYISHCRNCEKPIRRKDDGKWRAEWLDRQDES